MGLFDGLDARLGAAMQSPMFNMGMGILANNTGHYGAFGPAVGTGVQQGMQQINRNREMLMRNKIYQQQMLQQKKLAEEAAKKQAQIEQRKLYSEAYNKLVNTPGIPAAARQRGKDAYLSTFPDQYAQSQAMMPSPPTTKVVGNDLVNAETGEVIHSAPFKRTEKAHIERLIEARDRYEKGSANWISIDNAIKAKGYGKTDADTPLTKSQQGQLYLRELDAKSAISIGKELVEDLNKFSTPLFAETRADIAGVIGGIGEATESKNMQEFADQISPAALEQFRSKALAWQGQLRQPLMKEGRMSDQDREVLNNATVVLKSARSKAQMKNAITAINGVVKRSMGVDDNSTNRKEGEEWVDKEGFKRKMVSGKAKYWSE